MAVMERRPVPAVMYKALRVAILLMSFIPFRVGQFLGRILGKAFAMIPLSRTMVSLENIRHAFGGSMSETAMRRLNRRVAMHFGQMLFEVPHILRLSRANLERYVVFEGRENLLAAIGKGKGVFVLTGHFGNWELMSAAISLIFAPGGAVVVRPIDFEAADRVITGLRSRFGTEVIPKQRAIRRIMKAVQENRTVGILLDQNVDWYEGVFVPFLNRPACTNKGLALMAQRTGAPVIPAFSVRQEDGTYRIVFEKEVTIQETGDRTSDIEENTALFTRIIEKYIRRYPDHWFWFHRRWKTMPFCRLPDESVFQGPDRNRAAN